MNNLDLNIENYNLDDLLSLFKLSSDFTEEELKRAKKIVYMVHPDKSKLPKEYFIFFAKAYKYVYNIYEFKRRKNKETTEYSNVVEEEDEMPSDIPNLSAVNKNDFHSWFNKMFEKYKLEEEDSGYEDWLKEEETTQHNKANNIAQLHNNFDEYKSRNMKDIVKYKHVQEVCNTLSSGGSMINKKINDDYSSTDIFTSGLIYNDVKKAHTESFIPVTREDYEKKEKYGSEMHLKIARNKQMEIPSMEQSQKYIQQRRQKEEDVANQDAYEMLRRQEKQDKLNQMFMKDLRLLK